MANKTILCVIDSLGPGGAERQMTGLAIMLKEKGYTVFLRYHGPKHFFTNQIKNSGIDVMCLGEGKRRFQKVIIYRKEIKRIRPDVVISFLQSSSILTSILRLSGLEFKLIVSERNTNTRIGIRDYVRFNLYRIADWVVPNSYSQEAFIKEHFPFLSSKVKTIVNYVDIEKFKPIKKDRGAEILVAATIWPSKNTVGFIKALKLLKDKGINCHVKWFGKVPDQYEYYHKCESLIEETDVSDYIDLLDKTPNIAGEYSKADYFCLPSFYEGTPNVICEALASGLPVVCSNVCDNGRYVQNRVNGFLFDPQSAEDMAAAIECVLKTSDDEYLSFKNESRRRAEIMLSSQVFINSYLDIIE